MPTVCQQICDLHVQGENEDGASPVGRDEFARLGRCEIIFWEWSLAIKFLHQFVITTLIIVIKRIFVLIQTTKDMQTTDADDALSLVMYCDLYNRDEIT